MRRYLQFLILITISSCGMFAYGETSPVYLNFIKAKNIYDMAISINSSCGGLNASIPDENINTGFYNKTPSVYYLKVKANLNDNKFCLDQLSSQRDYFNEPASITYFPDFPKEMNYEYVVSVDDMYYNKNSKVYANPKVYWPKKLFFSVTGTISLTLKDGESGYKTSIIPITFALGKTSTLPKDYTWVIIGDKNSEFYMNNSILSEKGQTLSGRKVFNIYTEWSSGIRIFDPVNNQSFCLSSNLKDNNTILITTGTCQVYNDSYRYLN